MQTVSATSSYDRLLADSSIIRTKSFPNSVLLWGAERSSALRRILPSLYRERPKVKASRIHSHAIE
jgi:hypothetical protein